MSSAWPCKSISVFWGWGGSEVDVGGGWKCKLLLVMGMLEFGDSILTNSLSFFSGIFYAKDYTACCPPTNLLPPSELVKLKLDVSGDIEINCTFGKKQKQKQETTWLNNLLFFTANLNS